MQHEDTHLALPCPDLELLDVAPDIISPSVLTLTTLPDRLHPPSHQRINTNSDAKPGRTHRFFPFGGFKSPSSSSPLNGIRSSKKSNNSLSSPYCRYSASLNPSSCSYFLQNAVSNLSAAFFAETSLTGRRYRCSDVRMSVPSTQCASQTLIKLWIKSLSRRSLL